MSLDMFPDAAIDYIINHPETGAPVSDQATEPEEGDEFITLDAITSVSTTFYPEGSEEVEIVQRLAGVQPFVFLELVQDDGAIGAEVTASWVEDYETLIELLETFTEVLKASLAVQNAEVEPEVTDADD